MSYNDCMYFWRGTGSVPSFLEITYSFQNLTTFRCISHLIPYEPPSPPPISSSPNPSNIKSLYSLRNCLPTSTTAPTCKSSIPFNSSRSLDNFTSLVCRTLYNPTRSPSFICKIARNLQRIPFELDLMVETIFQSNSSVSN